MKTPIPLILFLFLVLMSAGARGTTNPAPRVSVAEVEAVRLEVEQPTLTNEFLIRVRDFAARNRMKRTVTCDIYYVVENGREEKIATVILQQVSATSDDYSGNMPTEHTFTHGTIAKVVYRSPALRLPISTWYAFYYH